MAWIKSAWYFWSDRVLAWKCHRRIRRWRQCEAWRMKPLQPGVIPGAKSSKAIHNATTLVSATIFSVYGFRWIRRMVLRLALGFRDVRVGSHVRFVGIGEGKLVVHRNVTIDRGVTLDCTGGLTICSGVCVSEGARIYTHGHHFMDGTRRWMDQGTFTAPLCLCSDVWIGANAVILPKTAVVGYGAIVGAGAVVTKYVSAYSVVAGAPAMKISERDSPAKLLAAMEPVM